MSRLSKLDMNDVDSEPGLSKMDVVLSFSLEVCVHLLHSLSHRRFVFTQCTVHLFWRFVLTGSLYSPSAQSVSLEVCVH